MRHSISSVRAITLALLLLPLCCMHFNDAQPHGHDDDEMSTHHAHHKQHHHHHHQHQHRRHPHSSSTGHDGTGDTNNDPLQPDASDVSALLSSSSGPTSAHDWMRTEAMESNGLYVLDWRVQGREIYFRITANTRGFVGLGFSLKSGLMADADLVLAWVDDRSGKPTILDCHGSAHGHSAPLQDDTQNYIVDGGYQNATHTQIQFHRALETCDPHDLPLSADTVKVLWSYGESDPIYDRPTGHGSKRGVRSLHLMAPMARRPPSNRDVRQWDVTVRNVTIDANMDTLYWCKIFKAPILQDKHHIVGYEALLTKEMRTQKSLVHHITLFECTSNSYPGSDPLAWDVWVKSGGAVCNSNLLTPRDWDSCVTPIASWAVSSTGHFLPGHVGIPMGGTLGPKYYMLEIHYDNPSALRKQDHSGIRLHYTRRLRANDGGMIITGVSVSDTQLIPPQQRLYRNVGICGPSCTDSGVLPATGIRIVAATLHSHVAGRKMKLRHVRAGIELERIVEDDNYDYAFQQVRQLANETVVLPGDYLITDCAYETLGRRRLTFGGYSTKQEMCLSFVTYYPRVELAGCYSMTPVVEFFEAFGVYGFDRLNMTDVENLFLYNGNALDVLPSTVTLTSRMQHKGAVGQANHSAFYDEEDVMQQQSILNKLIISDPAEFHDRSFLAHLYQLPWSEPLFTRRVEQSMLMGKHMTFCRVSNETLSLSAEIIRYPNFTTLVKPASHCPFQHHRHMSLDSSALRALTTHWLVTGLLILTCLLRAIF